MSGSKFVGSAISVVLASLCGGLSIDPAMDFIGSRLNYGDSTLPVAFEAGVGVAFAVATMVWIGCCIWLDKVAHTHAGDWILAILFAQAAMIPGLVAGYQIYDAFRDRLNFMPQPFAIPGFACFGIALLAAESVMSVCNWTRAG
jgi:hypothetical protein